MTELISHPFNILPSGVVETADDASDEYKAQRIALLILTRPGERPLVPTYGMSDPVFGRISAGELALAVEVFGPPDVTIVSTEMKNVSDTEADVFVTFE